MAKQYKSKPSSFFMMSVICLLGFMTEFLMLQIEQALYSKHYYSFTITESIMHWILVCILWGLISFMMFYTAVRVFSFDISKRKNIPRKTGLAACLLLIIGAVVLKTEIYGGWKIQLDFMKSGWFQFIFQYIYYLFEVFLTAITITMLQEWCERIFKIKSIPYGGIIFALTWGASHIVTQGSILIGICYIILSVMFGMAYLFTNKNLLLTSLVIALLFLL